MNYKVIFLDWFYRYFEHPWILLLILPLGLLLWFVLSRNFFQVPHEQEQEKYSRSRLRFFLFFSRFFVFSLLLLAFANPSVDAPHFIKGDPQLRILVDNSSSFSLFNADLITNVIDDLGERLPLEVSTLSHGEFSALGDGILQDLDKHSNLLLLSDGYVTHGSSLSDVALHAQSLNATLSTLTLEPIYFDASVSILGPSKTVAHAENEFFVHLEKTHEKAVRVVVEVDGRVVYEGLVEGDLRFTHAFQDGYHRITARLLDNDFFSENNVYYKTVKVVPKPLVALLSPYESPLEELFSSLYDLRVFRSSGSNFSLSDASAVLVNNHDITGLDRLAPVLTDFVSEGNGLAVVGGPNAYESGAYKGSQFEQLLPSSVAKAGRRGGRVNIILLIDISGSTGDTFGGDKKVDVEKALAVSVLEDLSSVHNVGVVAFNTQAYLVANLTLLQNHGEEIVDKISRLKDGGGTRIAVGLSEAISLLEPYAGGKNIILISDGKAQDTDDLWPAVAYAATKGITVYSVGVGGDTREETLKSIASSTGGSYFKPERHERLKILFGDLEEDRPEKDLYSPIILDDNHFITQGLDLNARIFAFNSFVPKTSAKLLLTTDTGDPLLTVWRFGLGRVASLALDDGSLFSPDLLNQDNSLFYTRVMNWVIGDPERNNPYFIDVSDVRRGDDVEVLVKSDAVPQSDHLRFTKIDEGLYKARFVSSGEGFSPVHGATYAVNYPLEYQGVGVSEELLRAVHLSGGKVFDSQKLDEIVSFVKSNSRREVFDRKSYAWIFLFVALLFYLLEVAVRRLHLQDNLFKGRFFRSFKP